LQTQQKHAKKKAEQLCFAKSKSNKTCCDGALALSLSFFGALLFLAICRVQLNQEIAATTSFARLFWFLRFCFLLFAFGVLSAFAFAFCVLLLDFVLLLLVAKRPTYLFIYFFSSAAKKKE